MDTYSVKVIANWNIWKYLHFIIQQDS